MKWKSTAQKNAAILILSLLPFIIGLSYSVYRSPDKAYLSAAINIAGSQRMRTMLISNYTQQLYFSQDSDHSIAISALLDNELKIYLRYYNALIDGDHDLNISENNFEGARQHLVNIEHSVDNYYENAVVLLKHHGDYQSLERIINSAMLLKDEFHEITELYQLENDRLIQTQKTIDIAMISFAVIVTLLGLFLTIRIKRQEYHASYDYLTGLRNRYSLFEFFKVATPENYTVFFMDLNKFKIINDTYGHEIGDEILIEIGKRLKNIFSLENLYRYGGDEFIGLVETKRSNKVNMLKFIDESIAEVKRVMSAPIVDSCNRSHVLYLSMGIVSAAVGINDWNKLVNLADDLMYDSKSMPGHVVKYLYPSDLEKRNSFFDAFGNSFNKNLYQLNYQQFSSVGKQSFTIENVTSRWVDHDVEYFAAEFMPALKRKGYITELDMNALKVFEQDMLINANQSSENRKCFMFSFAEETLMYAESNGFIELLKKLKFPVDQIILKVQEDYFENPKAKETLKFAKDLGCSVAVDNFTFNLSINNIEKYNDVELIKIDHATFESFTANQFSITLFREFINYFLQTDKILILEGVTSERLASIKSMVEDNLHHKLFYAEKIS